MLLSTRILLIEINFLCFVDTLCVEKNVAIRSVRSAAISLTATTLMMKPTTVSHGDAETAAAKPATTKTYPFASSSRLTEPAQFVPRQVCLLRPGSCCRTDEPHRNPTKMSERKRARLRPHPPNLTHAPSLTTTPLRWLDCGRCAGEKFGEMREMICSLWLSAASVTLRQQGPYLPSL